jgi:hypothetical protein
MPSVADHLRRMTAEGRRRAAAAWALDDADPDAIARTLVDDGRLRAAAAGRWRGRAVPASELRALGLLGPGGLAWEAFLELGRRLDPRGTRLATQLGEVGDADLVALAVRLGLASAGGRHATARALLDALLDDGRISRAVEALPREVRLRVLSDPDVDALVAAGLLIDPRRRRALAVELAAAIRAHVRRLEALHQNLWLADIETALQQAPRLPLDDAAVSAAAQTRLRAGALAAAASGYDVAAACERSGLSAAVVGMGVTLAGGDRLDGTPVHAQREGLLALCSPASPARTAGEALLGQASGEGTAAVGHLTWVVLGQLAVLPAERALSLPELATLVALDADALPLSHPGVRAGDPAAIPGRPARVPRRARPGPLRSHRRVAVAAPTPAARGDRPPRSPAAGRRPVRRDARTRRVRPDRPRRRSRPAAPSHAAGGADAPHGRRGRPAVPPRSLPRRPARRRSARRPRGARAGHGGCDAVT